jgi:putative ABC transport system permease protein
MDSTDHKTRNVFTVVGVIRDYHYQSLHKKIAPLIIINSNKFFWSMAAVRVKGDHFKTTLATVEKLWHSIYTSGDFHYAFLDQQLAALYKAEQTEQRIFTIFSTLAILIACIGLLGLATYSVRQREKEISIRKVLGAMPGNIVLILSKEFLTLIGVASLIAFPLAGWAMHSWLQNFAYRVEVSWWIFLLAGALALFIAMLTISYQAVRAALESPIKSLKSE